MKIAGLMPLRIDPEKSLLPFVLLDFKRVCDEVIVLHDRPERPITLGSDVTEELTVTGGDGTWNDFINRATLLTRAAKYGCRWVMWLDDDETLSPEVTRLVARQMCEDAEAAGCPTVKLSVRTAWDMRHWRTDGIFGNQRKPVFQMNPFMQKSIEFQNGPEQRLHAFPLMVGPVHLDDNYIIHFGMRTRALREKNVAKYEAADLKNEFSSTPYRYLLDEQNIKLQPL